MGVKVSVLTLSFLQTLPIPVVIPARGGIGAAVLSCVSAVHSVCSG